MQVNIKENVLIAKILGVVIALVVVGMVLVPFIDDARADLTVTKTNDYGIFASANANETLTINCSVNEEDSTKYDWTVNGETIQFDANDSNLRPLLIADTINVYLDTDGKLIVSSWTNGRFTGQTAAEFTLTGGIISGNSSAEGSTSHNYTNIPVEWLFYASEKGDYRSFYLQSGQENKIYFTDINEIYGSNFIFTTNKFYSFHGTDVTYYVTSTTPTHITATVDSENVRGTVDMKVMDLSRTTGDYSFIVDNNGTDYTAHPWQYIVPYEVSSDAVNNKQIFDTLYQIIPILVVLGLVIAIVGMFVYTKYDN